MVKGHLLHGERCPFANSLTIKMLRNGVLLCLDYWLYAL